MCVRFEVGPGGRSSFFMGSEATLEGNHGIQFLYNPPLSSLCVLYTCSCVYVGGGMGCAHVKYGGQKSMLGIFLERVPIFVRQGLC